MEQERLQKYMAKSGVASRRHSEELIKLGQVTVNGVVVTEMGYKVGKNDVVAVNGIEIVNETLKYYVMNKPRYLICSSNDEKDRETVISILPASLKQYRLFPVGRLDYDTKGVLLLTNDGEFMNNLVGPKSLTEKEYLVRVEGIVTKEEIKKLIEGVVIEGGYKTRRCNAYLESVDKKNNSSLIGIILQEGKKHQVKNMVAAIGHKAKRLTRIRFGCISLEGLKEGEIRELTIHEVKTLLVDARTEKDYIIKKARRV